MKLTAIEKIMIGLIIAISIVLYFTIPKAIHDVSIAMESLK